ncbi:MAG TPA: M1 family aminopeptidase [Draconibacterium sp.]|nr:M1 family aminopeptidase [Draconibacterium sp.]
MLKILSSIFFLLLTVAAAFAQQPDPDFTDKIAEQEKQKFMLKSSFRESQNYADYDLVYQRMEWEINPDVKYIKGKVTSYFVSQLEELTQIEFDLNNSTMTVDSVFQHNQKIDFTQNNKKLRIVLSQSLQVSDIDSISVFYQGEPEPEINGFGSFTKSEHAGTPTIFTLSEPYGAMEWWPCKQSLTDKIDSIDIIVTSPEMYRTASNGVLVSDNVENGLRKMHWKHRHPIATYLVAIAVTNYSVYSDWLDLEDGRKIEILNYVYPEDLDTAKVKTPVTAEFIELYNQIVGEYPFADEKYGHAQFGWGGGMEHQTMSFMHNFNYDLIAHELAHQWFGDYITCGSWQDIWLNEGFATYMTGLVYENLQDGYWWPTWKNANLNRITSLTDGSVYVKDTTIVNDIFSGRLSYSKGAYLLHMLRWVLGDDNFFKGLRNYFNDPKIANGFAYTNDLVRNMEIAGDTVLTEFFNDWFYGEGFPLYSAEFTPVEEGTLKIILSQTSSHPSVDFFEMPVPVRVYNFGKTDSMDFRLVQTANNQEFFVEVDFNVAELKIDPDRWLISKTSTIVSNQNEIKLDKIGIYPNPFTDNFHLFLPPGQQLISVKLFTREGLLIKESNGNEKNFYWPELSSGVYFLQIKTGSGIFEQKIVKL